MVNTPLWSTITIYYISLHHFSCFTPYRPYPYVSPAVPVNSHQTTPQARRPRQAKDEAAVGDGEAAKRAETLQELLSKEAGGGIDDFFWTDCG